MNWGTSIVVTFILFAGFIGGMVFLMSRQQVDLVRDDYYQDEIAYQRHINRLARTTLLTNPVTMTYEPTAQQVTIVLPDSLQKGEVTFYRPSDRRQDMRVNIKRNPQHAQRISTEKLAKGYWKVQLNWSDGQLDYFKEESLFIQ
jgi:hypothetical protein